MRWSLFCPALAIPFLSIACSDHHGGQANLTAASGERPTIGRHLSHDSIVAGKVPIQEVLDHGRQLFLASFNTLDGAGRPETTGTGQPRKRRSPPENFDRISAPDSNSCAGCHNSPFAGGGGDNVANVFVLGQRFPHVNFDLGEGDGFEAHTLNNVADERNTLGMFGAGFIELLAREMTKELQETRATALAEAQEEGVASTAVLTAKTISFGTITAYPDGAVDTSRVEGVDQDLVVRPFHQKGVVVSLREFTNNAMNHHHGMQSQERFGEATDPDGDGVINELTVGDMTAVTLFQATLPAPGRVYPGTSGSQREAVTRGETLFDQIGCTACHVPTITLDSPIFTEPSPYNPKGNLRLSDVPAPVSVDLTQVGPGPYLQRKADGSVVLHAYTDLKRHDMGPELNNEQLEQGGVPTNQFITRKLWGMANEPPYMHHGRALTLGEAILMHGGEALAAHDAFLKLLKADQDAVIEFLKTLQVVEPGSPSNQVVAQPSGIVGDEPALSFGHVDQKGIEAGNYTVAELMDIGKRIFGASFNTLDGAGRPRSTGTGDPRATRLAPQNFNRLSGPDSNSCVGCHSMPRIGGGGDNVANVFVLAQRLPHVNFDGRAGDNFQEHHLDDVGNERNTLGMWGSGFVELLAREMTADLHQVRDQAIARARQIQQPVTLSLTTKGIGFGSITASPDGSLDLSKVVGIDDDLVVKPFHQKGVVVSLRQFTNNALNHHHGMQSSERFGAGKDPDGDGKTDELTVGDVTALTLFQALLPVPGRALPADPAQRAAVDAGEALFVTVGCAECHVPSLVLNDPVFTEPNPLNPAGNLRVLDVSKPFAVDLTKEGIQPRLARNADGSVAVPLYSDLKRHDLGPECDNEKLEQDGVSTGAFLTRKLWGLASEPPFLHHGRALTLTEAIEAHGGEAATSRTAFRALSPLAQAALLDFLKSLQVLPEGSSRIVVR